MNILLIGGGGREHALAWKIAQSPLCTKLFAAPGNPGIAAHATLVALDPSDHAAVVAFAREQAVGLVVVGPEAPLVTGLADALTLAQIPVFGPSAAAAQLEGSKGFTKDLCRAASIPTAAYVRCTGAYEAELALNDFSLPVVIKDDGLASGKGVVIAQTKREAKDAIRDIFAAKADAQLVIEEFMTGEEVSYFAISDGNAVMPFGTAQDHKQVGEGDTGPNTGGMGAYSPAPVLTPALEARVMQQIIGPAVSAMALRGMPYKGILFAGLMLTRDGPKLIEFNCRFGDPECEVLMLRLESDIVEILSAVAEARLDDVAPPRFAEESALTVVMAANGYPGTPQAGGAITLPATTPAGTMIFQAGTAQGPNGLVANGGRVLAVTACGATTTQARDAAYALVDAIDFPDGFCRRDIGWREVARETAD